MIAVDIFMLTFWLVKFSLNTAKIKLSAIILQGIWVIMTVLQKLIECIWMCKIFQKKVEIWKNENWLNVFFNLLVHQKMPIYILPKTFH